VAVLQEELDDNDGKNRRGKVDVKITALLVHVVVIKLIQ